MSFSSRKYPPPPPLTPVNMQRGGGGGGNVNARLPVRGAQLRTPFTPRTPTSVAPPKEPTLLLQDVPKELLSLDGKPLVSYELPGCDEFSGNRGRGLKRPRGGSGENKVQNGFTEMFDVSDALQGG